MGEDRARFTSRAFRTQQAKLVWILLGVLFAALPAAARYVKSLDVPVELPVYRLPVGLPLPNAQHRYVLRWSGVPVGTASVRMTPAERDAGISVVVHGATYPAMDWLYRYRFWGNAHVHTAPFAPDRFVVDECTNRRYDRTEIQFPEGDAPVHGIRHRKGRVKEYLFHSDNTYDIPSAIYLLMNLDYAPGAAYELDTFTGMSRYLLRAEVVGRERVRAAETEHDAWRLRLVTRELTDDDPADRHRETHIWVTPERPRRLLLASSKTFVGAITLELEPEGSTSQESAPPPSPSQPRCS